MFPPNGAKWPLNPIDIHTRATALNHLKRNNMNNNTFVGRLAKPVELKKLNGTTVAKLTLIRNEYAGKDEEGNSKERKVAIQFTAFEKRAVALSENTNTGDQLFVQFRMENNNYTDKNGEEVYSYNFILEDFEFGAPGSITRKNIE
jgi:single-strand DNA-binding protein